MELGRGSEEVREFARGIEREHLSFRVRLMGLSCLRFSWKVRSIEEGRYQVGP